MLYEMISPLFELSVLECISICDNEALLIE